MIQFDQDSGHNCYIPTALYKKNREKILMNLHKCLIIVIVMVLSSMTISIGSSGPNQVVASTLLAEKEMGLSIGRVDLQMESNKTYVIITTPDLVASVHSLQVWKEYLGFSVEVVTVDWIASGYPGADIQEQIRNYLISMYDEGTPIYVLIVGSASTIPLRTCYPIPWEYPDHLMTDFYYADLTGDWNADDDDYFGEYEHDLVDFTAEAYVGRIPSDDPVLVRFICQNIIRYEHEEGDWKKHVLSLAAIIYFENMVAFNWTYARSDGATLTEECFSDIFQPHGYTQVCMYEKEGLNPSTYPCDFPLTYQNVISEWTKGFGIVNMLGHSSETKVTRFIWNFDDGDTIPELESGELSYTDFLRYSDGKNLKTDKPPIVYSAGCSQFHSIKNMGKEFLERGAAVAYIGTTDLSYYNITRVWNDESDGGAFSLDYYFFYYLINQGMKCADALSYAKSYFADRFMFTSYDADWIYRCLSTLYGFCLYGDPALGVTTEKTDTSPPIISVDAPRGYLYLSGRPVLPLPGDRTLVVGEIPIVVSATDKETGVGSLELWIDDVLKNTTAVDSLEWLWDDLSFFKRHTLKIVAIDTVGNRCEQEQFVWLVNT